MYTIIRGFPISVNLIGTPKKTSLLNGHFSIYHRPHKRPTMTQLTGTKRKADSISEDLHKDLVIANVEFCMMQFYKSQWEAQLKRTQDLLKENKKLKRENQHLQTSVTSLTNQTIDLTVDINDLRDINTTMGDQLLIARNDVSYYQHQLDIERRITRQMPYFLGHNLWEINISDDETDSQATEPDQEIEL